MNVQVAGSYQEVLKSAITNVNWKEVAIIQEDNITAIEPRKTELPGVKLLEYNIDPNNLTSSLLQIHRLMFPDINIVLSGKDSFIRKVLLKVDKFDEVNQYLTDFRHHSKWLIFYFEDLILDLQNNLTYLENVAVINTTKPKHSALPQMMTLRHHPSGNVFTPIIDCGDDVSMCYFPNVRSGYNNRHIRVMTFPTTNYVIKSMRNKTAVYSGYAIDILKYIAGQLNISYSISEPVDGSWGILKNGSWDGIVGNLQNKTIDLAAIDLTVTRERVDVIDFIYPSIHTDGISVLYKKISPNPLFIIARPLHWEVYLTILGVTIVMIATFHFMERFKIKDNADSETFNETDPVTRAVFRQGTANTPRTQSGKVLISFWWMFLMIVTGIYSGNQAASFSSSKMVHPFTTYEELSESDYYLLNEIHGIATVKFMTFDLPVVMNLREKLYYKDFGLLQLPLKEKLMKVKEGKFALLAYLSVANLLMADSCELDVIKEDLFFEHLAFAVPKQSPFKADIERIMSNLQEGGTLDMLWKKWNKKRNSGICLRKGNVQTISIETVAGSFIILACGLMSASIVLFCERCIHNYILAHMIDLRRTITL